MGGGSFKLSAEGDGISASGFVQLEGGNFEILAGGGSENAEKRSSDMWGQFMPGGPGMNRGMPPGGRPGNPGMGRPDFQMESAPEEESGNGSSMKGIKAGGAISINGGSFNINSADDGLHSNTEITLNDGEFRISSGDDAFHAEERLAVKGGSVDISDSYEGLEALHIEISGGKINITADDDGINAAGGVDNSGFGGRDAMFGGPMSANSDGSISISGGEINIVAYGDGIDANGYVDMSGGLVTVCGPSQGDTATLDYDTTACISGGTFIGTGGAMMAQSFSQSEQGVLALSVGTQAAGTEIIIRDSAGNIILQLSPQLDYCIVIVSTADMVKGESYDISVGSLFGSMAAN